MLLSNVMMAQNWVPSGPIGHPNLPLEAIFGGREAPSMTGLNGQPLYICRGGTAEGYGLQVGKFRADFTGCDIGYGGAEITVPDFEFLVTSWQSADFGAIPPNAVAGGYDTGSPAPPLYYCRAQPAGAGWTPGKIRLGLGGCSIPYGGAELVEPHYEVLVNLSPAMPLTIVGASNGYAPPDAIRAGTDNDGYALYLCAAAFGGGVHPGKLKTTFKGCDVSWGGTENVVSNYHVLVPRWTTFPLVGFEHASFDFPAGVDTDGKPLHICRAYYGGGVHPGKTKEGWTTCNIGWGGKEETSSNYGLLSSVWLLH
jgi:hypothetical protein